MTQLGAQLFEAAAVRAVELYEQGTAIDRKPEERIRQCFLVALHESPSVVTTEPEVGKTNEVPPDLPEWPNIPPYRLGGFDLAVRLTGDHDWRYLAELKCDSLWMVLWDLFKLAHASRLPGVEATFLIAIQLEREWSKPVACAELFDDDVFATRALLERYEARWRNMDGSSKSRPLTLPQAVELRRVADVPIETPYGPSRLRVASVAPTEGEWIRLDSDCWPLPIRESGAFDWSQPGPGMMPESGEGFIWPSDRPSLIRDEALSADDLPEPGDDWSRIMWLAASLDGYDEWGSVENLEAFGEVVRDYFHRLGELPPLDLRALRSCLFYEYRRHHFMGNAPDSKDTLYIRALVEGIRDRVAARPQPRTA
jgi:hypothetical protein